MRRPPRRAIALATGPLLLATGCAHRGTAAGPTTPPGAGTWVLVWVAAALAATVLGALLAQVRFPIVGGAPLATGVLALHAGATVVGGSVLAGLAVRSWPLADAKAAGTPASGTTLLRVSVTDGDPRFFTLMLVVVLAVGGSLTLLLTVAARFANGDDRAERVAACAVLALELGAAAYAVARVVQGQRTWPYVLAAAHLPVLAVALATCWPHRSRAMDPDPRPSA